MVDVLIDELRRQGDSEEALGTAQRLVVALWEKHHPGQQTREDALKGKAAELSDRFEAVLNGIKAVAGPLQDFLTGAIPSKDSALSALSDLLRLLQRWNYNDVEAKAPKEQLSTYDLSLLAEQPVQIPELETLRTRLQEAETDNDELAGELHIATQKLHVLQDAAKSYQADVQSLQSRILNLVVELRQEGTELRKRVLNDTKDGDTSLQDKVVKLEKSLAEKTRQLERVSENGDELLSGKLASRIEQTLDQVNARCTEIGGTRVALKAIYREERLSRIDTVYHQFYHGRGMALIWACIREVFAREFAQLPEPERDFAAAFHRNVAVEESSLRQILSSTSPGVVAQYLEECRRLQYKPNSGVLRRLEQCTDSESRFDLSSNFITDRGLRALLPVLHRLPNLVSLDLSDNGLQNEAVALLAEELKVHPGIRTLNLSKNRLSRPAAKDLIQLIVANPKVQYVSLDGTLIDASLQARINDKLRANRTAAAETRNL